MPNSRTLLEVERRARVPRGASAQADDSKEPDGRLRPVLKWAGGKRQLLAEILPRLPARIQTYYEPFAGGAAVFFALAEEQRFRRVVLSDRNSELMSVYLALRDDVSELIRVLSQLPYSEEDYYRIRSTEPLSVVERAARAIYLNRTGYNGLYRVNSRGQFNVPFGRYTNPRICDVPRLTRAARALAKAELHVLDFEEACSAAQRGDAVYFDPPYLPVSKTAKFAAYHSVGFGISEHERLAQALKRLAKRSVCALLSNSDTPETRRIFHGFSMTSVLAGRSINSHPERRGKVSELLVQNLPHKR